MNTKDLATHAHTIAVAFGAVMIRAEQLCNEGAPWDGEELTRLAGQGNALCGTLDGIYHTAKLLLSEDDFQQFLYRSGINASLIQEGLDRVAELLQKAPKL